jgi:uncharacterized paraquat-inducible protein A
MIPKTNVIGHNATKSATRIEGDVLKRLPIKKIYCPKCKQLVKGQIQSLDGTQQIICPICSQYLRVWKNTSWIGARSGVFTAA